MAGRKFLSEKVGMETENREALPMQKRNKANTTNTILVRTKILTS